MHPDAAHVLEPVLAGHHDVEHQRVEEDAFRLGACLRRAGGRCYTIAVAGEEPRQQLAQAAIVIDNQHVRRVVRKFGAKLGAHSGILAPQIRLRTRARSSGLIMASRKREAAASSLFPPPAANARAMRSLCTSASRNASSVPISVG